MAGVGLEQRGQGAVAAEDAGWYRNPTIMGGAVLVLTLVLYPGGVGQQIKPQWRELVTQAFAEGLSGPGGRAAASTS